MLSLCNDFKIFGNGDGKLILLSKEKGDEVAYVVNNVHMSSLNISIDIIDSTNWWDDFRQFIPGYATTELTFKAGKTDVITGLDVEKLINPIMNKSITDLLRIVNQKIKDRK